MRVTPENITELKKNEVFVFGSNERGIHGGGAAKLACNKFGAVMFQGFGMAGQSFAIPTKDWQIETLHLTLIEFYVNRFVEFVKLNPNWYFYVTKIGCGLAGYGPEDIAWMFRECLTMENVALPQEFIDILNG